MQIVSTGDNLHDMSNLFSGKSKKNVNLSSVELVKKVVRINVFVFFLIWVLRPFQEYFTYMEQIIHQRW